MVKLNVDLAERGYPIYIATDFSGLEGAVNSARLRGKILVVTDSNVSGYYLKECIDVLERTGAEVSSHIIEAGEESKTLNTVNDIYRLLAVGLFDRSSTVIALGGGVTGDIAGFAAATYMRGINFVQIPTSLLAQADSSIGGKTGVDFEGSKNMVGAFYQPRFVYINVNTLRTLPKRQLSSGLAEVIKHGLILNSEFYEYISYNTDKIFLFDESSLQYITKMNCDIKKSVVEQDERESGLRAILNFGHTFGHAVESASEFSLLHGECVSIGISGVFRLAFKMGMVTEGMVAGVENTLMAAGLPIRTSGMDTEVIYTNMFHDKKARDGRLNFILPKGIGEVITCPIEDQVILKEVIDELK